MDGPVMLASEGNTRYNVTWTRIFEGYVDPRAKGYPFMTSGPWPVIAICIAYMVAATKVGPWLMAGRDPINPRKVILLYNAAQIVFSSWLFVQAGLGGWFWDYNWRCEPFHFSTDPQSIRMVNLSWWFFISKFTEFMDTVFLTLMKKREAVSFLHVVHHGVMPISVFAMANATPVGHTTLTAFINPFVHIIMYTYYFIAALGPAYSGWIWWKVYLTRIQMIQFGITFVHASLLLTTDCDYPVSAGYQVIFLSILFLSLFTHFSLTQSKKVKSKSKSK